MHQRHYDPETLDYDQHGNVLAITDGATGRFQRGNATWPTTGWTG